MLDALQFIEEIDRVLVTDYMVTHKTATPVQLHTALGKVVIAGIADDWFRCNWLKDQGRRAYYLSAEYLMGRMVYNNLLALGQIERVQELFLAQGMDFTAFEDVEDAALGNGGLGRLAACFLDSAATMNLPLDGYGLRYKFGLFHQRFEEGFQVEEADNWQRFGDPWSRRNEADIVRVNFADQTVLAVPYDMPIIGYRTNTIGTLRLWQAQAINEFDFKSFNEQHYEQAVREKNQAEDITRVLYPNDSTIAGKQLRLKQQYFLASASMQDIICSYKKSHGDSLSGFAQNTAIQLNDTHPVVSIPELIRLFMLEGYTFDACYDMAISIFSYTNHTVMVEALEKWDVSLLRAVIPEIFEIILRINTRFCGELLQMHYADVHEASIIQDNVVHMANLASAMSRTINGVARLHSEILKRDVLRHFYALYPERFQNKTNGVTQRRWLLLCNKELSAFITARIGDGWITDLSEIARLKEHMGKADIAAFNAIKLAKKQQLSAYIANREGVLLPPHFLFDVQVKRMHEYKRQILNALAILDIYYGIREGRITDFMPTAFLFGAKAAPGYFRAKSVIKFINEIARLVNNDPVMREHMRVVFVENYNCSYAERIIPAADISEQISPAGTEASGTGNMKLMLNGAVTLGTFDGANVEIAEEAGVENNFIFGRSVDELNALRQSYSPQELYNSEARIRRVVDTLDNGTFGRLAEFDELKGSLLGGSYGCADQYFVLLELLPYIERKLDANRAYRDSASFGRMCLMNTASAGKFSSDRTIAEYAKDIWGIEPL